MLKLHRCLWWWARIEIKRSEAQGRWSEQREHVPGTSMVLRWGPGPSNFLCHESQESQIRSWSHPGLRAHHEQQVSIPGWKGQWRKTRQSLEYIPHIFTVTQILGSCKPTASHVNVLPFFYSQRRQNLQNQGMWLVLYWNGQSTEDKQKLL